MAVYVYAGRTEAGSLVNGEVEAHSEREAVAVLRRRALYVTHVAPKGIPWSLPSLGKLRSQTIVSQRVLLSFTRQFATMVGAGVPLLECLHVLAGHAEHPYFRQVLEQVHRDIEAGAPLAEAMRRHPRVFSEFYLNMVEVGEVTGCMDVVLLRTATHLEKQASLRGRISSAVAYPLTLLGVACVVLFGMLVWVVPLFEQMFAAVGETLPWMTQVVVDLSAWLQEHIGGIMLTALVSVAGIYQWIHTTGGRRIRDRCLLRAPLIGRFYIQSMVVHFARTLSLLVASGVPILEGLRVAGKVSGNLCVEDAIQSVGLRIREGQSFAEPLAASAIFPPLVTHMINVGESTGTLDQVLEQVADLYEQEADRAMAMCASLLEPAVILLIGAGVGMIVTAMYLPLFSMGALIG